MGGNLDDLVHWDEVGERDIGLGIIEQIVQALEKIRVSMKKA